MNNVNMIMGRLVKSMEAFKGSKPVINKEGILSVRSVCRDSEFEKYNSIKEYLTEKLVQNGFELASEDDILEMVAKINELIGDSETYSDEFGFEGVKSGFENIGCDCDYVVGKKGSTYVGVSMWYEKLSKEPKFVEVMSIYNI
ncbi:conserved hypothetical protein [Methanococcus maripaludis C5]|uniref:Uncharacterized protein n=1 Tax=Methanococcus maripaludis (strain C5 / ATCC BAA-1333) TaxID=402880 RepID=A4FW00_METM5|nr:DUF2120 family protein [Methanococcus maripaludis]ABO34371.1 conserved hypothetical protein [Methanococcus maripaludis C5]